MPEIKDISTDKVVAKVDYDLPNAEEKAQEMSDSMPNTYVDYAPGVSYDAMSRSTIDYAGQGKTGYNKIGISPKMPNSPKKEY